MIEMLAIVALWIVVIAAASAMVAEEYEDRRRDDEFLRKLAQQRRWLDARYGEIARASRTVDDERYQPPRRRAA